MFSELLGLLKKHDYLVIPCCSAIVATFVVYYLQIKPAEELKLVNYWDVLQQWVGYFLIILLVFFFWAVLTRRAREISPLDKADVKRNPGIYYVKRRDALRVEFRISLIKKSRKIDMLGWNLNRTWFEVPEIVKEFEKRLSTFEGDVQLRVLLPTEDSVCMEGFRSDRDALGLQTGTKKMGEQFASRYVGTRNCLIQLLGEKEADILRLLKKEVVFSGILRFDEIMIVTYYLSGCRGSASPAIILHENARAPEARWLFRRYVDEFENLWETRGRRIVRDTSNEGRA